MHYGVNVPTLPDAPLKLFFFLACVGNLGHYGWMEIDESDQRGNQ
jgi:hypothetical protein